MIRSKWPRSAGWLALAVLGLSASPREGRADYLPQSAIAAPAAAHSLPTLPSAEGDPDPGDEPTEEEMRSALRLEDVQFLMCFAVIGDVPVVRLAVVPGELSGSPSPLPEIHNHGGGDGGSSPDTTPMIDTGSVTPANAPEPAAWVLGSVGAALAAALSLLRRHLAF